MQFTKVNALNPVRQFRYSFTANLLRACAVAGVAGTGLTFGFLKLVAPLHYQALVDIVLMKPAKKHE